MHTVPTPRCLVTVVMVRMMQMHYRLIHISILSLKWDYGAKVYNKSEKTNPFVIFSKMQ